MATAFQRKRPTISVGVPGLDNVLLGGLTPGRLYLVEGDPGAGKTTLAIQFLLEGTRQGESVLYVTLSETKRELLESAENHDWDMSAIHIHELVTPEEALSPKRQLTMFHPSELELNETTKAVLDMVEAIKPRRVVFDSLSEMRLLAQNPLRFRRQILALKQFFAGRDITVLLLDDRAGIDNDKQLQSIAHGVIALEQRVTEYGAERRQIRILKMRGVPFRGGFHDYVIRTGGLDVFPRLVAAEHRTATSDNDVSSGVAAFDSLLAGGIPTGSSTLFLGPAGCGKSTVALQFCMAAAARGDRAAIYIFDETTAMVRRRLRQLGMPLERYLEEGLVTLQQVDPAELSPGEFAAIVRSAAEGRDANGRPAKVLMIDSLNGYLNSMSEEKQLTAQLHELFTYLNQMGAVTLVAVTQAGFAGSAMKSPVDTTYLADNVVLFRYFESFGLVRRAVSVLKKRGGEHELSIRELRMNESGIHIGPPLEEFQGILTGVPTFHGDRQSLMNRKGENGK